MVESFFKATALLLIGAYRSIGSAWLGGACRFEPSCSQYAVEAFQTLPVLQAFKISAKRISKCRPGGGFGFDPMTATCNDCKGHHE